MTDITFSIAIDINATKEQVWDALVNPDKIEKYLFGTKTDSTFKVGDAIVFTGSYDGHSYRDMGTVLKADCCKTFEYSYLAQFSGLEDLPENYQKISYQIESQSDDVQKLTITQTNIHTEEAKEHSANGWKMVMEALKTVVEEK